MKYVSRLNPDQIGQALKNSLAFWSGGKTYAQVIAKFTALRGDEKILSMAGILDHDENVTGSLKRYFFDLDSPDGPIKAIALGAIYTREEFRNRGIAKTLIQNVLEEAKQTCDAAILFSDIGTEYYEKFGFQSLQDLRWMADAKTLLGGPTLNIRLAEKKDTDQLRSWYEKSFSRGTLRIIRSSREIWNFQRQRSGANCDHIVSQNNIDVGYFNANVTDKNLWIHEFVLLDASLEKQMNATIAQFSLINHRDTLAGWLRSDNIPNGFVGTSRGQAIPMILSLRNGIVLPENDSQVHFSSIDHV